MNELSVKNGLLLSSNIPNITFTSKIKRLESTFVLEETNIDEIPTNIHNLKNTRNTALFGISNEIPKLCSPNIETLLCEIVKNCKIEQTIPNRLRLQKFFRCTKK